MFAPSEDSLRAITTWLSAAGVEDTAVRLKRSRGVAEVPVSTRQLKLLVGIDHQILEHRDTGAKRLDNPSHTVPTELKNHVETMWSRLPNNSKRGVTRTRSVRRHQSHTSEAAPTLATRSLDDCGLSWTPACIRGEIQMT